MGQPAEWGQLLRQQAAPRVGVHVTDCLGCPRRKALAKSGAPVQLDRLEARLNGQMLHRLLGEVDRDTSEWRVHGNLFGQFLVGSVDRLREPEPGELSGPVAPGLRVFDYKGEKAEGKSRKPDGVYPEQAWQFEVYRYLLAGMGIPTVGWTCWFRYGAEWLDFSHDGPVRTEEELAAFRPHGGAYNCQELATMAGEVEGGTPPSSLPLVGQTMKLGKGTSCDYCEMEEACKETAIMVDF